MKKHVKALIGGMGDVVGASLALSPVAEASGAGGASVGPIMEFIVSLISTIIGGVVVLAVLAELCLLQAATLRRKVRAVLPPEEGDEEGRDR